LASLSLVTPNASAQARVTLVAGATQWDLSGTGGSFTMGGRVDMPIKRIVLIEGGATWFSADQQFGDTTTVFLPEVQGQVQYPAALAPYAGLGIGLAVDFREDEDLGTLVEPTFSAALGVRLDVNESFGLRAELRVRGHEPNFTGTTADWTGGVSWRF
jgi:hypothetical protein